MFDRRLTSAFRRSNLPVVGGLALTYGLTALAGVWAAYDRPAAWARFALIALGLGLLLLLAWAGGRWGQAFLGPFALVCAGLAGAVGAYYLLGAEWQAGTGAKLPALQQVGLWVQAHRPVVALPEDIHPNVAGGLLAILLPLAAGGCAWAWLRARRALALAGGLAVLLSITAVVLTLSRGAWLGLAAAAVLALGWSLAPRGGRSASGAQRPRRALLGMLLTAALVLALALPLLFALVDLPLADRLFGSVAIGSTAIGRTVLWRDAWALIGDYPFTGSGLGMTAMVYSTYVLLIHAPYLDHMHSLLLQIAVEQGVLAAALFAMLLGRAAWVATVGKDEGQPQGSGQPQGLPLRVAALAALAALVVHGALDAGVFVSKAAPVLFLPLGVAYGAWRKDEGGGRKDEGGILHPSSLRQAQGKLFILHPFSVLLLPSVLAAAAALLLLPTSQAAFQANLGSLSQTRAELAAFHWPATPLQDVLRRPGGVDLAPAEARFAAALSLSGHNVSANRRLGQIALANEDFAAARGYLEAAYAAAPDQRATRQMLGELEALDGDPAAAAALWRGLDFSGGALQVREWWYGYLGRPDAADAIRQAAR